MSIFKKSFRKDLENYSDKFKVINGHGNFLMLKFPNYEEKSKLLDYLAEQNIFVRDTTQADCVKSCFRITIGTREQMKRVIKVLTSYYD